MCCLGGKCARVVVMVEVGIGVVLRLNKKK